MKQDEHQVLVLDDDPTVRRSLDTLLTANGFRVRLHAQPDELFAAGLPTVPACLLLDNQLADGMTGVQVHSELLRLGWDIPTVFLTGHFSPITSKCTTCDHFKVHHFGWVFSDGLRGWLARM